MGTLASEWYFWTLQSSGGKPYGRYGRNIFSLLQWKFCVMMPTRIEEFEFVGNTLRINCFSPKDHLEACSSKKDHEVVCCRTGLRVYEGSKAFCMLLSLKKMSDLISLVCSNGAVIELGCGCGLAGLYLEKYLLSQLKYPPETVILSDGEPQSVEIVARNITENRVCSAIVKPTVLCWAQPDVDNLLASLPNPKGFSFCFGCELMYFRVSFEDLLCTVTQLMLPNGLGLFVHAMRVPNGKLKLREAARAKQLSFLQIPFVECFKIFGEGGALEAGDVAALERCDVAFLAHSDDILRDLLPAEVFDVDERERAPRAEEGGLESIDVDVFR